MSSRILLTFFHGPNEGMTFVVEDKPVILGRDAECDVALSDDRASRRHARIVPEGDHLVITDESSSNGTFVNGMLVTRHPLGKHDIIDIGSNRIVVGREIPSRERLASIEAARRRQSTRITAFASPTAALENAPTLPPIHPVQTSLTTLLETVAQSVARLSDDRGVHIAVEAELKPETVFVDPDNLGGALTSILQALLELTPMQPGAEKTTLALRSSPDSERVGYLIEFIWIGPALPIEAIKKSLEEEPPRQAGYAIVQHRGSMKVSPGDAPDTLVRIQLPFGSPGALGQTLIVE